jgi:hypothetical protein
MIRPLKKPKIQPFEKPKIQSFENHPIRARLSVPMNPQTKTRPRKPAIS